MMAAMTNEPQGLFTLDMAAQYLQMKVPAVRYHVYKSAPNKLIPMRGVGHDLHFTQSELDRFQRERRKPGNPNFGK